MSLFYAWLMFWLTTHSGLEVTLLRNCESFFHCLLASSDAGEKSEIILIPDSLDAPCFSFFETCRIFLFWNFSMVSFDMDHCDQWSWISSRPIQSKFAFFDSRKIFWNYFLVLPSSCLFFCIFQKIYSTLPTFIIPTLISFLLLGF